MKRIVPFFLLIAFLVNSMGYYIIFEINKSIVRSEMQSLIQKGGRNFRIIKISTNSRTIDFHYIDQDEVFYKGNLFDVVTEMRTDSTTIFYCIQDVKEELLLVGLKKICNNKQFICLDDSLIKIALPEMYPGLQLPNFTIHKYPHFHFPLTSRITFPINPPPKPFC